MVAPIADTTTATGETVASKLNEWIAFCAACSSVSAIADATTATGETTAITLNSLVAACSPTVSAIADVTTATPEAVAVKLNLVIAAGCTVTPAPVPPGGGGSRDRAPKRPRRLIKPLPSGFRVPDNQRVRIRNDDDEAIFFLLD